MTTEEKIALAKAMGVDFGKTEIVFEKNVEYEIGNVEAGGIGVQVNQGVQTVGNGAKKPANTASQSRPAATFKMVNDVFTYKWTKQHPERVTHLYQYLVKLHAIDKDTSHEEFEKLFTGVPTDVTVKWIAPKSALKFLMTTLKKRGYIKEGKIWVITESHFKDAQNNLFKNMRNEHDPEYLEDVINRIADTLDPNHDVKPIKMIDDDEADELWRGIREKWV